MFRKAEARHHGSPLPIVFFRLLLSLTMFLILSIAFYQAFRYFNGTKEEDPLNTFLVEARVDPKTAFLKLISPEQTAKFFPMLSTIGVSKFLAPEQNNTAQDNSNQLEAQEPVSIGNKILRFAIVADSHNSNDYLAKALSRAKNEGAKFIVGLGDYTDVGTLEQLKAAKAVFDASGLPYYSTAGDHDLWDARDKGKDAAANYEKVFGAPYQSFSDSNIRFVILYNSDNYEGVDPLQMDWLSEQLSSSDGAQAKYVFMHEPVYHPSSDHMMGKTEPKVAAQAQNILGILKSAGVNGVFAGDTHAYFTYQEPGSKLRMVTVGALTTERNAQAPGFALVDVFSNGGYNIQNVEVK